MGVITLDPILTLISSQSKEEKILQLQVLIFFSLSLSHSLSLSLSIFLSLSLSISISFSLYLSLSLLYTCMGAFMMWLKRILVTTCWKVEGCLPLCIMYTVLSHSFTCTSLFQNHVFIYIFLLHVTPTEIRSFIIQCIWTIKLETWTWNRCYYVVKDH